jgi:hypothetical protein
MFINKVCPRCNQSLRIIPGGKFANCFFCQGYTYRETIRHEWFLEETRRIILYVSKRKPSLEELDMGKSLEYL